MVSFDFYPDYCTISKGIGGTTDENGDEVFNVIYSGECNVQFSSGGNTSLKGETYQSTPTLIVPAILSLFSINDNVVVTTRNGRKIESTIEQFETIDDSEVGGTTIWLKQGNG